MSKADALAREFGAHLAQTIGPRADRPAGPAPAPPAADRFAGAVKSRSFAELPVDAVARDESQPREEFDPADLRRLADSIARFGQLAPIRVRRDEADDRWVVLVGERRLRACKLAGLDRVRVEFVERPMSPADILAEQAVENLVRAPLSPVEQGRAYRRLMELHGWTAKDLSEAIGVEATAVYRGLALLRLPDDVAGRVDAGEIKATAAYEIAKLRIAGDQREVADAVVRGGLDHRATAAEVARRRGKDGGPAAKGGGAGRGGAGLAATRVIEGGGGYRLTVEREGGIDLPTLVGVLRAAADRIEGEQPEGGRSIHRAAPRPYQA